MKEELILDNVGLVYHVLQKMNLYDQRDYYYSAGIIGLIKAANAFDPEKGIKFATYASRCIQNEILMECRRLNAVRRQNNTVSLYEPVSNDTEGLLVMDFISSDFDIEEDYINKEQKKALNKAISMLNDDEKELINCYYYKNMNQCELAKKFGITQCSISRNLTKCYKKLRKYYKYEEV